MMLAVPCKQATNKWFPDFAFHGQRSPPKRGSWPLVGTLRTQITEGDPSIVRECRLHESEFENPVLSRQDCRVQSQS